jgi:hypothetical protein
MGTKFKMITLTAATLLTLSLAGQSFAAMNPFTDLANVKAKDKILAMQEAGYVHGVTHDLFLPHATITAAQGIQLIVKALDLNLDIVKFIKEPKATDYYKKANNDAWYADALIISAVNGIELPADLNPNQKWTREEFTHQLIHAIEINSDLPMIKLSPVDISDQDQITVEYQGSIQRALAYSVVLLDADGNFNPKAEISRADATEQIYNALEYIKAHPAPEVDPNTVPNK